MHGSRANEVKALWTGILAGVLFLSASAQGVAVLLPQDRGPRDLNVQAYPAEIQQAYDVFSRKCSKCHTLARPLNTSMTPDYWALYVGLMMDKPASNIGEKDAKAIYMFLAYDQTHRKDKNPGGFFPPLTDDQIVQLRQSMAGR
jgi:hypothetical protein